MTGATEWLPFTGFLLGLLGSPHCLGMCGGLATALDRLGPPTAPVRGLALHLLYFLGRAAGYASIGALAGAAGPLAAELLGMDTPRVALVARVGLGVLLLVVAGAIAGLGPMRRLESLGGRVWAALRPIVRRLAPLPPIPRALALGLLWGWLPCGMVYAAAATSGMTGSGLAGTLFMLGFAFGTLPAVVGTGVGAGRIFARLRARGLRRMTAAFLAAGGLWTLLAVPLLHAPGQPPHAAHARRLDPHGVR